LKNTLGLECPVDISATTRPDAVDADTETLAA
jgi:hypothetical protein